MTTLATLGRSGDIPMTAPLSYRLPDPRPAGDSNPTPLPTPTSTGRRPRPTDAHGTTTPTPTTTGGTHDAGADARPRGSTTDWLELDRWPGRRPRSSDVQRRPCSAATADHGPAPAIRREEMHAKKRGDRRSRRPTSRQDTRDTGAEEGRRPSKKAASTPVTEGCAGQSRPCIDGADGQCGGHRPRSQRGRRQCALDLEDAGHWKMPRQSGGESNDEPTRSKCVIDDARWSRIGKRPPEHGSRGVECRCSDGREIGRLPRPGQAPPIRCRGGWAIAWDRLTSSRGDGVSSSSLPS